jgi:hypothetical protein
MKNLKMLAFPLLLILLTAIKSNAQFLNLAEAKKIKASKVILALTDSEEVNEAFRNAVINFWTLTKISEELPAREAIAKLKSDGSVTVLMLGKDVSKKWTDNNNGWTTVTSASGIYIGLNTKGDKNANLMQYIPEWSEAQLAFGLSSIEDMVGSMIDNKVETNFKLKDIYAERGNEIKGLTLLINEKFLDGMNAESIRKVYPHKFEIMTDSKWKKIVLSKTEGYCYLNSAPVPVGDGMRYVSYVMSTTESKTFAVFLNGPRETSKKTFSSIVKAIEK